MPLSSRAAKFFLCVLTVSLSLLLLLSSSSSFCPFSQGYHYPVPPLFFLSVLLGVKRVGRDYGGEKSSPFLFFPPHHRKVSKRILSFGKVYCVRTYIKKEEQVGGRQRESQSTVLLDFFSVYFSFHFLSFSVSRLFYCRRRRKQLCRKSLRLLSLVSPPDPWREKGGRGSGKVARSLRFPALLLSLLGQLRYVFVDRNC